MFLLLPDESEGLLVSADTIMEKSVTALLRQTFVIYSIKEQT